MKDDDDNDDVDEVDANKGGKIVKMLSSEGINPPEASSFLNSVVELMNGVVVYLYFDAVSCCDDVDIDVRKLLVVVGILFWMLRSSREKRGLFLLPPNSGL